MRSSLEQALQEGQGDLVRKLLEELSAKNAELSRRDAELSSKNAELSSKNAELSSKNAELSSKNAELSSKNAELSAKNAEIAAHKAHYESLKKAYKDLELELKLLKRRLFIAKAERVDTAQLELEFATVSKKLELLAGQIEETAAETDEPPRPPKTKPTGRRNLHQRDLPVEVEVLTDSVMESLVAQGKATCIRHDISRKLHRIQAQACILEVRRAVYQTTTGDGSTELFATEAPPAVVPRCLVTPTVLADICYNKFALGLPLERQAEAFRVEFEKIDSGTMSRWVSTIGKTLQDTVVRAMNEDARANAFCIATDATGFLIQPGSREGGPRRPCNRGHYWVRVIDRSHIVFEYTKRHRTVDVTAMFRGYSGYVQVDACSVYNALFRTGPDGERVEVGCFAHARRKFWEAAQAKERLALEGLLRLSKIFSVDEICREGKPPPSQVKLLREQKLAPLIEEFIAFCEKNFDKKSARSPLRTALGYVVRQQHALRTVLQDGRLKLDNNRSERELRKVVRIRDASLFAGSDEHAENAAGILTVLASAKLHGLNPREYLRDLLRVLRFWPEDRYLELSPLYWSQTRARLDDRQMKRHVDWITVPEKCDLLPPST